MTFNLRNVSCSYGGKRVLTSISFSLDPGDMTALIGPNGAGKTTLLRCMANLAGSYEGEISIDGEENRSCSRRSLARKVAYLPQRVELQYPFTVRDFISMSRYALREQRLLPNSRDEDAVSRLMERLRLTKLSSSSLGEISGGELQRVFIAGALAQEARYILLDEPASSLDPLQESELFSILREVRERDRVGILFSTHRLTRVLESASRILALKQGQLFADGTPTVAEEADFVPALYGEQ